ncbi:MAG: hypothetical protein H7147_12045 [Frankiaceae bacterium]|nr:hypothetical protein [Arenimonas sp.]
MTRVLSQLLLLACLVAAGCAQQQEGDIALSAEQQARASAMLADFETARKQQNWEVAEAHADKLRTEFPDSAAAAKLAPGLDAVREQAGQQREARRLKDLWDYQSVPRGKGPQRTATLYSRTPVVEEGQPAINPDAQLVLRDHPDWGRSSYLLFAQSKFRCGPPCRMDISFDGGDKLSFAGKQADSGKGPALFIEDEARFIQLMSAAREVRIQLPKGSGSATSLVFEVSGFDDGRYAKP